MTIDPKSFGNFLQKKSPLEKLEKKEKQEEKKSLDDDKIVTPDIIHKYLTGVEEIETPPTPKRLEKLEKKKTEVKTEDQKKIDDLLQSQLGKLRTLDALQKKPTKKIEVPGIAGVEYEEYDLDKIKFMRDFPRHEMKHKHHSAIIIAKRCFREYFFSSVINMKPAEETNIFFPWGTAYHIFRQKLNELYGYGEDEPATYDEAKAKESFKEAAKLGTKYWMENGEDQKPDSKFDWFTTERLYKSFIKAFEHWVVERKQGQIKVIAVEQFFNVQLIDGSYREGVIDEAVEKNGELWGRDFKTTSKPEEWFTRQFIINNQVRTYSFGNSKLANRSVRGLIVQALYNSKSTKKGDKGPDIYEKLIEVTDYELKQWELEQTIWNRMLAICRDEDVWPQSEVSCQWCDYFPVCSKSSEASMIYTLENKYKRQLRDPYNSGLE